MRMPKKLSGYSVRTDGAKTFHRMYDTDVVITDAAANTVTFTHGGWPTDMTKKCIYKAGFDCYRKDGILYVVVDGTVYQVTSGNLTITRK